MPQPLAQAAKPCHGSDGSSRVDRLGPHACGHDSDAFAEALQVGSLAMANTCDRMSPVPWRILRAKRARKAPVAAAARPGPCEDRGAPAEQAPTRRALVCRPRVACSGLSYSCGVPAHRWRVKNCLSQAFKYQGGSFALLYAVWMPMYDAKRRRRAAIFPSAPSPYAVSIAVT